MAETRRRRPARTLVAVLAALVLAWLVWAGATLWSVRSAAEAGMDHADAVRSMADGGRSELLATFSDDPAERPEVTAEELSRELRAAADAFEDVEARVSSPQVWPLRLLPVLGRQVRSADALATSASEVATAGAEAVDGLAVLADAPTSGPAQRVESVRTIGAELAELQSHVDAVDLGPDEGLVAPLWDARDTFAEEVDELGSALADAVPAAQAVAALLEGPSRLLLLAANNAEMRAGSGMYLQLAPLEVAGGELRVGPAEAAEDLLLPEPGAVADPDVERNWGWLLPTREFRNVNLTPRFEESARMAAEMWAASGRGAVDGAMAVDVLAVRRLLQEVGPVSVDAGDGTVTEVDADTVLPLLLRAQYQDFEDDRDARREQLSRVLEAVLDSLNGEGVSAVGFFEAVWDAAEGRHLMVWSTDQALADSLGAVGGDGVLRPEDLAVGVINRGGDKLDQFLDASVTMSTTPAAGAGGGTRVELTLSLTNTAPDGLPAYVAGPHPASTQPAGTYQGFASFSVPGAATDVATDDPLVAFGPDGPSRLVATEVLVPRGATVDTTVSFTLAGAPGEGDAVVRVVPSARSTPVRWRTEGSMGRQEFTDAEPRELDLGGTR